MDVDIFPFKTIETPFLANSIAIALPIPLLEPVTIATFPSRLFITFEVAYRDEILMQ